jgi:hypothetical protein
MVKDKVKFENFKYDEIVELICDFCGDDLYRTKRKSRNIKHYCNNNKCAAQHKSVLTRERILSAGEKKCQLCGDNKKLKNFNKSKATPDGYNNNCRDCSKSRSKKYYSENREHHIRVISKRNKKKRIEDMCKVHRILKINGCIDCGNNDPRVLDFDHKDDSDKKGNLSEMIGKYSWKTIENEINKCDVRCSNCHRIRTAEQFGYYKYINENADVSVVANGSDS